MRKKIYPIKYWFATITLFLLFESCNYQYDVVVEQTDGTTKKFKCKNGKDTLNSTVFRFYEWILVSKWNYVDGKKEGSIIDYYPDGTINIISNCVNDLAHGVNKVYDSTGTLIRRSFYIKNKQVLFEQFLMENVNFPGIYKSKLVHINKDDEQIWAGELYVDENNKPTIVGYQFYKGKPDSAEYKGMYVNIDVKDTLNINEEYTLKLDITLPKIVYHPEILIGEFDKELTCIDTNYYAKSYSVGDSFTFKFRPNKQGNNYLIGRLSNIDGLVKDDIYFFDGFYVK